MLWNDIYSFVKKEREREKKITTTRKDRLSGYLGNNCRYFLEKKNPRFFCLFDSHKLLENRHLQKKKKKTLSGKKHLY